MELSVVIPTRDRRDRLLATLEALGAQETDGVEVEVLVVDNASTDGTADAAREISSRLPIRVLTIPEPGTSAARNAGIRAADGTVVLLLGDDTPPALPDLLVRHAALHREEPDPLHAVLGHIGWAPDSGATDFMRWIGERGFQFAYGRLEAGPVSPPEYLYSSHASLKRELLLDAGLFDERVMFGEDIELGIRLARRGTVLAYRPELLVYHDHPWELSGFERRMETSGRGARVIREIWPDDSPETIPRPSGPIWWVVPPAAAIAGPLLRLPVRGWIRDRAWTARLLAAYRRGYRSSSARGAGP